MLMAVTADRFPVEQAATIEEQADEWLARWAARTKGGASWLGLPRRSVTEAAREGFARGTRPPTVLSDEDAATDRAVAQLDARHDSILRFVIKLRYEELTPKEYLGMRLHCSRRKGENLLKRAQRAIFVLRGA